MPGPIPRPLRDRFFEKVLVGNESECWPFQGHTNGVGYGMILVGQQKQLAHRVAWELEYGPIPSGCIVLHLCDNPGCVNPDHLQVGTQRDNMRDRSDKCRDNFAQPWSKLTAAKARNIIRKYRRGLSQAEIGKWYGVSKVTVSQIVRGEIWQHATKHMDLPGPRCNGKSKKLTEASVRSMRTKYAEGSTQQALSEEFLVSKAAVQSIVTRRTWKHVK